MGEAVEPTWCWQCNSGGYVVPANTINPKGGLPTLLKCLACYGRGRIDLATLTNAELATEARRRHEAVQTIQAELKRRKGEH